MNDVTQMFLHQSLTITLREIFIPISQIKKQRRHGKIILEVHHTLKPQPISMSTI